MIDPIQPGLSDDTIFDLCTEIIISFPCISKIRLYTGKDIANYMVFVPLEDDLACETERLRDETKKLRQDTESTFGKIFSKILVA